MLVQGFKTNSDIACSLIQLYSVSKKNIKLIALIEEDDIIEIMSKYQYRKLLEGQNVFYLKKERIKKKAKIFY